MRKLRVLDLFSGIGGFSLGLERTGGFETVAFCEIEPFPRKVLAKHWPEVPCYDDVRTLTAERLAADGIAVDVICGGFPCQDISTAGSGAGLAGERSGLWSEIARLVGELEPRFVIVENVAALLSRGLGDVLGDLAALRYNAEWHCIPASIIGAHHRRDRIWIIAYPEGNTAGALSIGNAPPDARPRHRRKVLAHSPSERWGEEREHCQRSEKRIARGGEILADASSIRHPRSGESFEWRGSETLISRQTVDAFASRVGAIWGTEPAVGRVAHGVPDRAHRLKGLGNAVVPQIPELIGHAILASIAHEREAA